jgi:hypothetical protein
MMSKKFFGLFVILIMLCVTFSCNRDPKPPVMLVSPGNLQVQVDAGGLVEFNISAFAGDFNLARILIQQKPINGITSTLMDTTVSGSQASFIWIYTVPQGNDDVVLTFRAIDTDGADGQTARRLVVQGNSFLSETSGHLLYSRYSSGVPNAFNIDNSEALFLATNPDSTTVDMVEFDETNDETPGMAIRSYSGIKFVRNNSFNYPEATAQSAQNTFSSSTPLQIISNLQVDDILITKYDTTANGYAIIKITGIDNNAGSDADRYTFNLKK